MENKVKNIPGEMQKHPNHQKEPEVKATETNAVSTDQTLIENECREKIAALTRHQENELKLTQEAIDAHLVQMIDLHEKRNLVKRSLKIAKKKKMSKTLIRMIRDEAKMLKANIRQLKALVKEEKNNVEVKREVVELLKTLI
jgi:hypothetical protein